MARRSAIEWTQATWNPVTGCSKVSDGCLNCYAERMARRLQAMGQPNYAQGFHPTLHPKMLDLPLSWKRPSLIFVNSMSDLFHEQVPTIFIREVFDRMNCATRHTFQVLTKRSRRLRELSSELTWSSNIWMGVSIESSEWLFRTHDLQASDAKIKFISFEPLLGPIQEMTLSGIDWVIVGGESGPGARPMEHDWVVQIQRYCADWKVPFFFKQWGGRNRKRSGRLLDGRTWDAMPAILESTGARI
jgi:protein gp37